MKLNAKLEAEIGTLTFQTPSDVMVVYSTKIIGYDADKKRQNVTIDRVWWPKIRADDDDGFSDDSPRETEVHPRMPPRLPADTRINVEVSSPGAFIIELEVTVGPVKKKLRPRPPTAAATG